MTELAPCPFLQKCHIAFESMSNIFFVLDLIEGGDIFSRLASHCQRKGFTEIQVSIILSEVALELKHLHEHGYIHQDIKVHWFPFSAHFSYLMILIFTSNVIAGGEYHG